MSSVEAGPIVFGALTPIIVELHKVDTTETFFIFYKRSKMVSLHLHAIDNCFCLVSSEIPCMGTDGHTFWI